MPLSVRHRLLPERAGALGFALCATVAGLANPPSAHAQATGGTVVEYVNSEDFPDAPGGHFFYSSDPPEQVALDAGTAGKFRRTGLVFYTGGNTQVCRFYGSVAPGPNSHFFTADTAECNALKALQISPRPTTVKQWNYEGLGFSVVARTAGNTCPGGSLPVYRAYNNGPARGVDANHRYSTSIYALGSLTGNAGWTIEGVVFCSQSPPNVAPLISEVLDCGSLGGAQVVAEKSAQASLPLQRRTIDLVKFPDAVCNDGTAALFYYRPYAGESNRNRWVFDVRGGGHCSNPADCAARWCSVDTNFNMNVMTANFAGATKAAEGILARESDTPLAAANPHKDYNQIEFKYCSSDQWTGTVRDVTVDAPHPLTGVSLRMRLNFVGARNFDAMIATLRRDGTPALIYSQSGQNVTMPDLDDADEVLLAGASAGGAGVTHNLDRLRDALRATNTKCTGGTCPLVFRGLTDSRFPPSYLDLDFSQSTLCTSFGLCSAEAYLKAEQSSGQGRLWRPRLDQSCIDLLTPLGSDWRCYDLPYVVRNHLTTPFFVRMGLTDALQASSAIEAKFGLPGQGPFTLASYALKVRADLQALANIRTTAFERNAITTAPGAFGPSCSKHDTLESNSSTYQTSVRVNSVDWTMFEVWNKWVGGQTPNNIVSSTTTDAVCPSD